MEPAMSQDTPVPDPAPDAVPAADPHPAPEPVPPGPEPVPEPVTDAGPEPEAEPVAEAEPVPVPEADPAPVAEPEPVTRRRRRTTVLIAAAAVLGVLAGAGTGYGIQYDREPTPLAPLAGAMPVQPKGAAPDVPALPASQDRAAIYDGNLLDLLVPIPKGAEDSERRWVPLVSYAEEYEDPDSAFERFAMGGFQRSVLADWTDADGTFYEIDLVQFRDESAAYASSLFPQWSSADTYDPAHGPSGEIPGTVHGNVWPSGKAVTEDGYEPEYHGRALAQVGNILVDVFVDALHPVKAPTILSVINKQLERL
jgi:hypothetical protein